MQYGKGKEEEAPLLEVNGPGTQHYQSTNNTEPLLGYFTGSYATNNVPMTFQELLIELVKLRKNLEENRPNFSDYIGYFTEIARVLERIYEIICAGDPNEESGTPENITVRIAKSNENILKQIEKIKEGINNNHPNNQANCYNNLAETNRLLAELNLRFTYAIEGPKADQPNRQSIQPTATRSCLEAWINTIGAPPSQPPKWYFLRYAHVYAKRHIQAAAICTFFIISALAQATAVWIMTDRSLPSNERRPLHAYLAFPLMIAVIGTTILLTGCIKAYRKHTRPFEATAYNNKEQKEQSKINDAETETGTELSTTKNDESSDMKKPSASHYEKYNVPTKFQELLNKLSWLRENLKLREYTEHFTEIAKVLGKIYLILDQDDLREGSDTISAIDLRISNNNTIIGAQLAEIKKKIIERNQTAKNMSEYFTNLSEVTVILAELGGRFTQAIAGHKNPGKYPPPSQQEAVNNDDSNTVKKINAIGNDPTTQSKLNFIRYAPMYSKKHIQTAKLCVLSILSALVETAVFWIITDLSLPSNERRPTRPYMIFPFAIALSGVVMFAIGLLQSYRQLNASKLREDAAPILPPNPNKAIRQIFSDLQAIYNGEGSGSRPHLYSSNLKTRYIIQCRSYLADHESEHHDWQLDGRIRTFFERHSIRISNLHFPDVSEAASLEMY